MPVLGDLYELLLKQAEPEAQNIATALEIYVNGSLNVFNHRSNIDMNNHRVLCFQLKSLGKALKEIGLLIMQDAVWNRVTANRSKHKTTWFYTLSPALFAPGLTGSFCQRDKCLEGKMACGRKIDADITPEDLLKADYPALSEGGAHEDQID